MAASTAAGPHDAALIARVIALAHANVDEGGRPFACVIADSKTGEILAESGNKVAQSGDPTAHAEMIAIREASAKLRTRPGASVCVDGTNGAKGYNNPKHIHCDRERAGEDFKGFSFYILTDPCPMCMAAMHYCGPDRVVYATTRREYAAFYRDDRRYFRMEEFYAEIGKPHAEKKMPMAQVADERAIAVYKAWNDKNASGTAVPPAEVAAAIDRVAASGCPHAAAARARGIKVTAADAAAAGGAAALPKLTDPGHIDARRAEVLVDGKPVPAWGDPEELAAILRARETEFGRLIDIVAVRGDPLAQYFSSLRDIHLMMRDNYSKMIASIGRNIYPLIIASDYEPGLAGVGSTFTLYLDAGNSKRITPCPPEYEMYKSLAHMPLGLFTVISPYFKTPTAPGWRGGLSAFKAKVQDALASVELTSLPEELKAHGRAMLSLVAGYIKGCEDSGSVDVATYMAFTKSILPLVQKSVMNAARLQAHAAIPELLKWKEELGARWRDVHVLIPTVWPVSGRNPRQQIFEELLDADRVKTHIIKAEGAKDIDDARNTLGRVVGDRTVAQLIFGTESADARNLVCALSTPRDIVASACDDAIDLYKELQQSA